MEYKMQCIFCWEIFNDLANPYKYIQERSTTPVMYPVFSLAYAGVMRAVTDYRKAEYEGFLRIYQYEYLVDFIPEYKKDSSLRCAYADTSKINVTADIIRQCIKEAWDWERSIEFGLERAVADCLSASATQNIIFTGPKRRSL